MPLTSPRTILVLRTAHAALVARGGQVYVAGCHRSSNSVGILVMLSQHTSSCRGCPVSGRICRGRGCQSLERWGAGVSYGHLRWTRFLPGRVSHPAAACGLLASQPLALRRVTSQAHVGFRGSYVTESSMSAGSNALPRFLRLCTNSKKPRYRGSFSWTCPDAGAANSKRATGSLPWYSHALHKSHRHRHPGRTRPVHG
jgi:hypothetical protein